MELKEGLRLFVDTAPVIYLWQFLNIAVVIILLPMISSLKDMTTAGFSFWVKMIDRFQPPPLQTVREVFPHTAL